MSDTPPSATPMPAQPVATVTSPEAPSPPADPLPVFVPPSVTDPVSNLDFPPVDDAFALEMRAETIEQLAGGDALRRGESERIEAGRSQTNADLVAGRDRVRVRGALHEHTGHGLAEQAAHLHTTVEGTLDIHAASEDTVLLAGHMSDLWDGGGAIVAAMTDDTVAGGGIRVTTPLDLWLHGLMGVEERIGTCTADAVLLELGATHYEREYGPGVHAAGLAAYTGSLYQSSRSTFRPLMRVSSGVRNLIAGGGGGGGGGDAGAGDVPAASPPAPAAGGAGTQAASKTVSAATGAGGTAQAGVMAGVRSQDLTGIHRGDEVAALDSGTNVVGASWDLTGLRRGEDTAGQLAALRDAMRGAEAGAQREVRSVSRVPAFDDTASVHEASAPDIVADIRSGATVPDLDTPVLHSTVSPPQPPPGVKLGLLGGADRLPQPAAPESDFLETNRRLQELLIRYRCLSRTAIVHDVEQAAGRISNRLLHLFRTLGGNTAELAHRPVGIRTGEQAFITLQEIARQAEAEGDWLRAAAIRKYPGAVDPRVLTAEQTYGAIQEMARQAESEGDATRVHEIRKALDLIAERAVEELQALCTIHDIAEPPSSQAMQRPPAHTTIQSDWTPAYRQLRGLDRHFSGMGGDAAHADFQTAADRISLNVMRRFRTLGGNPEHLRSHPNGATKTEQAYHAIEDMVRHARNSRDAARADEIRQVLETIDKYATRVLDNLTTNHDALDALSIQAARTMPRPPMQLPPATVVSTTPGALPAPIGPPVRVPPTTVPPLGRLDIPVPAHPIALGVDPAFPEPAGGLVHTTGVPGPPPASSLPEPSLSDAGGTETAGAQAGDLGRGRLDPPATTAGQPTSTEAIVTPSPAGPSSFWLQPVNPWPAPGTVPVDPGLHHAGETALADVPAPPPASSLPEPSLSDAGGLGRTRLDPPAATAGQPTTTEAIVTPSLAGPSSSWLQPADPVPATGAVPFDPGLHNAGETAQPPPGPSSRVVYTEANRTPVMSTGAPPGRQGAETPGFDRAASGAVELPVSQRVAIARQFGTEDAWIEAVHALHTGGADALGWSHMRWLEVLHDLYLLNAIVQSDSPAAAATLDVDWSAIEALVSILDVPPPSPRDARQPRCCPLH